MSDVTFVYTSRERLADGVVHVIGIAGSLVAAGLLVGAALGSLPAQSVAPVGVYAATLVALFVFSAGYHLIEQPQVKRVLRRIDHATIYLMIAGTYTPLALMKVATLAGYSLLACIWVVGLFGMVCKLFWPEELERTSYVLYLAAGWSGLLVIDELLAALSPFVLVMLGMGGLFYTIGVAFHLWRNLPYHNVIWHVFVLAGATCHYVAIFASVLP